MTFRNREHAARLLATKLKKYAREKPMVVGIPRGAVPMARVIADELGAPMSAVLVHKIPHPQSEELAIGCVSLGGQVQILPSVDLDEISRSYVERAAREQLEILKTRQKMYGLAPLDCKGRVVILVDDGIATGATTRCAIAEVRAQKPKKIILAAAVIPKRKVAPFKTQVEELVVLDAPDQFFGVGDFFEDFSQVTDDDVMRLLDPKDRQRSRAR